jgi:hypothetical protein
MIFLFRKMQGISSPVAELSDTVEQLCSTQLASLETPCRASRLTAYQSTALDNFVVGRSFWKQIFAQQAKKYWTLCGI